MTAPALRWGVLGGSSHIFHKSLQPAMEAAGQGQRYVPMLADFIAGLNGLPPAADAAKT